MSVYLHGRHFVGAYDRTGSHANGFFSNRELFNYKKDLYVTYYNPLTNKIVGKQKAKLNWNKIYKISDLPISLPNGYSDDPTYFLPGQSGTLGLESLNVWTTRVYVQWNVIPITGRIQLVFNNTSNQMIASYLIKKPLFTPFNIKDYTSYIPTNFTYSRISSGQNVKQYGQRLQTVTVVLAYQPVKSTITTQAKDNTTHKVVAYNTVGGNVGDPFDISQFIDGLTNTGNVLVSIDNYTNEFEPNPQTITVMVTRASSNNNNNNENNNGGNNNNNSGNIPNTNPDSNQGTINIKYVDMNNKQIGSNSSTYITGFPFDVEPYELSVPSGYTFYQIIDNDELDTYPSGSTTITIQCYSNTAPSPVIPTPNNPAPTPKTVPASNTGTISAYRVFIDETNDTSRNPNTYNSSMSTRSQGRPHSQSNVIYVDRSPIQVPKKDNLKFSDIGIYPGTTIMGPDEYWEKYLNNESYVNLYEYKADTKSNISAGTDDNGDTLITVNCTPAFVRGVTFEFAIPNGTYGLDNDIVTAPFGGMLSVPQGWSRVKDPITNRPSFRIPYGYIISEDKLASYLFGGTDSSGNGNFVFNNTSYTLDNDRSIHIDTPYAYLLYCSK